MSLGRNLKELRQQQSLNQKDLSDRSGVSQATISRIETGRVLQPGSSALKNLADALGVSADSLMDDKARLARVHKDRLHQIAEILNAFVIHENGHLALHQPDLGRLIGLSRGGIASQRRHRANVRSPVPSQSPAHGRQRFVRCL